MTLGLESRFAEFERQYLSSPLDSTSLKMDEQGKTTLKSMLYDSGYKDLSDGSEMMVRSMPGGLRDLFVWQDLRSFKEGCSYLRVADDQSVSNFQVDHRRGRPSDLDTRRYYGTQGTLLGIVLGLGLVTLDLSMGGDPLNSHFFIPPLVGGSLGGYFGRFHLAPRVQKKEQERISTLNEKWNIIIGENAIRQAINEVA